jgi:hypothetical protein
MTELTSTVERPPMGEPAQPAVPRGWRATEAISSLATRLSFVAVAWVLLVEAPGWTRVGLVVSAQAIAYLVALPLALRLLDRVEPGRVSVAADLASALALAIATLFTTSVVVLPILVAILGALRAASDVAKNVLSGAATSTLHPEDGQDANAPPRESLLGLAMLAVGAAAGVAVSWLGTLGALWLIAMVFVLAALGVVLAAPIPLETIDQQLFDQPTGALVEPPLARRLAVVLFASGLLALAGAVILVGAWARDVLPAADAPDALGVASGAFVLGALGGGVVFTAYAGQPVRYLLLAMGYLAGGGVVALTAGMFPAQLLVLVVALVAGLAMASVTPIPGLKLTPVVPAAMRARTGALAAGAAVLGIPLGAFAAAWVALHASLIASIAAAAGCYLLAMLIPVIWYRTWQELTPRLDRPVTLLRRTPKLSARLSVTLGYADGQWLVEVRKGRALMGTRYLVNSAEALNMLALLDVPALTDRVGQALTTDRTEAGRQVERLRTELAELEAKLNGLTEMVDLSDGGKPV